MMMPKAKRIAKSASGCERSRERKVFLRFEELDYRSRVRKEEVKMRRIIDQVHSVLGKP